MDFFLQTTIGGLSNGAVYAALALALVVVFRACGHVNIAQGEMAMLSTMFTWFLAAAPGGPTWPIWIAVFVSMSVSALIGGLIQTLIMSRVEGKPALAYLIVTIGLLVAFNSIGVLVFGNDPKRLRGLFPNEVLDVGGVRIPVEVLGVLGVLILMSGVLAFLMNKTRLGLALRAIATNPESSRLSGIPYQRMLIISWALAAALGALAGALITTQIYVQPSMMFGVLIYALAAVILGGLDSPLGAIVGGLAIGVVEAIASSYVDAIGSSLKIAVPFVLILAVLLVRPTGIFGSQKVARS